MTIDLQTLRARKDTAFKHGRHSPLTAVQQARFFGLHYFPENPDLRFDLPIEQFPSQERVALQTTTGEMQRFVRYGRITFMVDGQTSSLTIYQSQHGFFLPFADTLAGVETYGAGRYLDPVLNPDGRLHVDFNLAYNPYCAYNNAWSCPITPPENRLSLPICAGEQLYRG